MDVRVQSSITIAQGEPHSKPTEIPLTIFDRFAWDMHVAVVFAFTPPTPTNSAIIEGLSNTLRHFPTLASRMGTTSHRRLPCLLVGGPDAGVLVVETIVESSLSDHLPLQPSPDFQHLHPLREGAQYVLQVQLNRFNCGGLAIGLTSHHRVADGQSMGAFFIAWGKMVRGLPIDPLPLYDLSWLQPRSPPRCVFQHWGREFIPVPPHQDGLTFSLTKINVEPDTLTNVLLHFSPNFINEKLWPLTAEKYTTFKLLLAHIWRKITIARGLDEGEYTTVIIGVNGRRRLRPPVPDEFFGNLVLNAYPKAKVKDLITGGVRGAAKIVHEEVAVIGDEYFRSFIDFGEIYEEEDLVTVYDDDGNVLSPNMEVDSWLALRFQAIDFGGGGRLCVLLPSWDLFDGLVIFLPSLQPDGGIDVLVGLLEEHARRLKEICHTLD